MYRISQSIDTHYTELKKLTILFFILRNEGV